MSANIVGMILIPCGLYLCLYISNETVLSMLLVFVQPMTLCMTVPCCEQLHPLTDSLLKPLPKKDLEVP